MKLIDNFYVLKYSPDCIHPLSLAIKSFIQFYALGTMFVTNTIGTNKCIKEKIMNNN